MDHPSSPKDFFELDNKHYLQTANRYPVVFRKGSGSVLWDIEGKEYIDALAGIAVNNLGHAHPKVVDAIKSQADNLIHISNFYLSEPQARLAAKLSDLSGLQRIFFGNSGAEAVEGAIKIARKYASKQGRGGTIFTMSNAFHGRTLATVAATGKKSMMNGFSPIPTGFCQVPFNNLEILKEKINQDAAGILLETVQGEGGIHPAEKNFLLELRRFCDEENLVLIFDEIQCGIGRTGKMFAFEHYGVKPDVMPLAKALGGGVPIGAVLASEKVASAIEKGDHGTTFGGNPLACSAALAVLEVLESENLLAEAIRKGAWFKNEIENRRSEFPEIIDVRGLGLMIGIELSIEARPVVVKMLEKGVLANATAGNIVRFLPPLNIPDEQWSKVLEVFLEALKELKENI
ncbi:MAG: aspartate aminotransferase family protein [Bacteroidota bacterium]